MSLVRKSLSTVLMSSYFVDFRPLDASPTGQTLGTLAELSSEVGAFLPCTISLNYSLTALMKSPNVVDQLSACDMSLECLATDANRN
jgi:hypothetical protein